jgi:peptidoglycan/LPS O-acetylase OafA/YrhL
MWTAAILSFAVSITVALLCYRLFEMPMRRLIVGMGRWNGADQRKAAAA